jgi:hypothetical protein
MPRDYRVFLDDILEASGKALSCTAELGPGIHAARPSGRPRTEAKSRMSPFFNVVFLIVSMSVCESIAAQSYELLFKGVTSNLTLEDQQQIFEQLEFRMSADEKFFVEYCDKDVSPVVEVVDLNGDGVEEVFVYWGNFCTSGNTERSISLFVRNADGQYAMNFGFPANTYRRLATNNHGFPDIEFGMAGFCQGVWQWNGFKYEYKCSLEYEPGGCIRQGVKTLCK